MKLISFVLIATICFTACEKPIEVPVNQIPIANAGDAQTIQLPRDSASLNGSGNDSDGQVVAYEWSEVSGPNAAIIVNDGAASTTIKGLTTGIYVFQLLVVDDMGAIGTDTVSISVIPAEIEEIIFLSLQPNQNPTEIHIWGNANLEATDPSAPEIGAATWTSNGNEVGMRALLKFDLSSIPSDATILSAKLTLYSNPTPLNGDLINANSGPDNSILIKQVTSTWDPIAVRWGNQPTTTTNDQIIIPHTSQHFLDLIDVNVSTIVSAMVNVNNGFLIRLQTEVPYNSRIFCSSKYSDVTKHPKLVVEYTE